MSWAAVAIGGASLVSGYLGSKSADKASDASREASAASIAEQRRQFDTSLALQMPQIRGSYNAMSAMDSMLGLPQTDYSINLPGASPAAAGGGGGGGNWLADYASGDPRKSLNMSFLDPTGTLGGKGKLKWVGAQPVTGTYSAFSGESPAAAQPSASQPQEPYQWQTDPGYEFRVAEGEKGVTNYLAKQGVRLSGRALKEMERFRQGTASQEFGSVFARMATRAGYGPAAANSVQNAGSNASGNISSTLMNNAAIQGNAAMNQGAAWNNAIQGGLSNWFAYNQNQNLLKALGG